jgi:hypothetical protein
MICRRKLAFEGTATRNANNRSMTEHGRPSGIGPLKSAALQNIINNSRQRDKTQRRWNPITTSLAYSCLITCQAAHRLFKGMAILLSVSLLYDKFQGVIAEQEKWLMDTTDIKYLVHKWRTKYSIREDFIIDVNLGVDAASCKPEFFNAGQRGSAGSSAPPVRGTDPANSEKEEKVNNFFIFLPMPIDLNKVYFSVHVHLHRSENLGKDQAHIKVMEIVTKLKSRSINVLGVATDGGRPYCSLHDALFTKYRGELTELFSHDQFETRATEIVMSSLDRLWWIRDILHALKCQRYRLEEGFGFDRDGEIIWAGRLNRILMLRYSLTEFFEISKINDVLAVDLFTFPNLLKL